MATPVNVQSLEHFNKLLRTERFLIANFYSKTSASCNEIAPAYEELANRISKPHVITFAKIDADAQKDIAKEYDVTVMPTFIGFRKSKAVQRIVGAQKAELQDAGHVLSALAEFVEDDGLGREGFGEASGSGTNDWRTGVQPRGYGNVNDQVETQGLDVLNALSESRGVSVLFRAAKPSALSNGKGTADGNDWVESDTDEQLLIFVPFKSILKLHTLQITSLPPSSGDDDDVPMRPRTLKLFINRPQNLGFDDAEQVPPTQEIVLQEKDYDTTGTVTVPLFFVRFQKVTSLVIFIVNGHGEGERVRVDRIRMFGEIAQERDLGRLEKIGHDH